MDSKGKEKANDKQNSSTRRPAREFQASLSKDGKYWLLRDTTIWFIPVNYLGAILKSASAKSQGSVLAETQSDGGANDRSH